MSMSVKFTIRGSAICYKKFNLWHIVFVCDDTHLLNFSYTGSPPPTQLRRAGVDRIITQSLDMPTKPLPDFVDISMILNMAGPDLHANNRLKVARTFQPGREIIAMTIPTGTLSQGPPTTKNYYVEQIAPPLPRRPLGRKVAAQINIDATLQRGRGVSMLILDGMGTSGLSFPYVEGGSVSLDFDNDCGNACKQVNDFDLYYQWLEDKDPATLQNRKFIAGKDSTIKSEQGNCDPVVVEPPPGP